MGAFVFGGFWVVLALPGILPPLRKYWGVFAALFVGVVCIRALIGFGVDPVLDFARNRAIAGIESGLAGEFKFKRFSGSTMSGDMRFEGVTINVPELDGSISIEQLTINAGVAMVWRPDGVLVSGRGFSVNVNAADERIEKYLGSRKAPENVAAALSITDGTIAVTGSAIEAVLDVRSLTATTSDSAWDMRVALAGARLKINGVEHRLDVTGGFSVADRGGGLSVDVDLSARDGEVGFGVMRGSLRPGGQGGIQCTIDALSLNPLWARYRKVDSYDGFARGSVTITGELNRLNFDLFIEVARYRYYHFTAMGLDPDNAFELPMAIVDGRIVVENGRDWYFEGLSITAPEGTLSTGKRVNAMGGGAVVLNGKFPALRGALVAVVESGELNAGITWSPISRASLRDMQPNMVLVGEQFPQLDLEWEVEIKTMAVNCAPLTGSVSGTLKGTFLKREGERNARLRAEGELVMADGKVRCLGLEADMEARLVFNPNAPTEHASLRGSLKGALGATHVDCELTGEISRPGFIFTGAGMGAEDLGRLIFTYSAEPLKPAQQVERREELSRVFGPTAAVNENPFEARHSGKVFFSVR